MGASPEFANHDHASRFAEAQAYYLSRFRTSGASIPSMRCVILHGTLVSEHNPREDSDLPFSRWHKGFVAPTLGYSEGPLHARSSCR